MRTLTIRDVDALAEELSYYTVQPDSVPVPDHRHRGGTCLGFLTKHPYQFLLSLGIILGSDNIDTEITEAFNLRDHIGVDQCGEYAIVYFPGVEVSG